VDVTLGCSEEARGTSGEEDELRKKHQTRKKRKQIRSALNPRSPPTLRKKKRAAWSPGYEAGASPWPSKSAVGERRGSPPSNNSPSPATTANPSRSLTGMDKDGGKWGEGDDRRRGRRYIGHGFRGGESARGSFSAPARARQSHPLAAEIAPKSPTSRRAAPSSTRT
jgi:hypothetical protein